MAQNSALSGMLHLVNAAVHIVGLLVGREGRVEIRLPHIGAESIDGLEGGDVVDGELIWAYAHIRAVLEMGAVVGKMSGAAVGVVG